MIAHLEEVPRLNTRTREEALDDEMNKDRSRLVVRHAPIYGFCRPLEGDCGVADARQETTLPSIGALH
jgi:hypothetical protein